MSEWRLLTTAQDIELYLLQWSLLHHNKDCTAPPLHPDYGLFSAQRITSEESEYEEWLREIETTQATLLPMSVQFEVF